jgi:hypothetical protein
MDRMHRALPLIVWLLFAAVATAALSARAQRPLPVFFGETVTITPDDPPPPATETRDAG